MQLDLKTDEDLMLLYQSGNENAFSILYKRHSRKVYGFLKNRLKQKDILEELYQEVFMKMHKSKLSYSKEFLFLPWMFTLTKNVLIDHFRKEKMKFDSDFDLECLVQNETTDQSYSPLEKAKDELPPSQKMAINMRYVDDKSFDEIAEALETSPSNVRQIISRGMSKIKSVLAQGGTK